MAYAIQMCETQASGPPKVFATPYEYILSRDEAIRVAKAHLDTAPLPNGHIVGADDPTKVFIRVVELDSNGSPTDRVVFEYKISDKG